MVVLEEVADGEDVRELIESFLAALRSPIPLGEVEVEVRTSIGVSCFPRDGTDGDTLLSRADIAMYYAKQAGGSGHRSYEREMDKGYLDSEQLASDLRRAINRGVRLHFQPIVSCRTLQVVGVEALVRWQHPQLGLLLPDAFPARSGRQRLDLGYRCLGLAEGLFGGAEALSPGDPPAFCQSVWSTPCAIGTGSSIG